MSSSDELVTLDCVCQGRCAKLRLGIMGSAMCLSAEKHSAIRGRPDHRRSAEEEWLESSENRKKASVLKQSVEGGYKDRKTMERSQDSECH